MGIPKAKINWDINSVDIESAELLEAKILERLANIGLIPRKIMQSKFEEFKDSSHHIGTTRMAKDPVDGVVDINCKVFGLKNLYVSGSSVFPTAGSANPTYTIAALSIRLADHLEQILRDKSAEY